MKRPLVKGLSAQRTKGKHSNARSTAFQSEFDVDRNQLLPTLSPQALKKYAQIQRGNDLVQAKRDERFKTILAVIATGGGLALVLGTFALNAIFR